MPLITSVYQWLGPRAGYPGGEFPGMREYHWLPVLKDVIIYSPGNLTSQKKKILTLRFIETKVNISARISMAIDHQDMMEVCV